MLNNKDGDLLKATEDIICHQCNTDGVFGGGLAYQIKQKYPFAEKEAIEYVKNCNKFNFKLIGTHIRCWDSTVSHYSYGMKQIANCFTQNEDYTTNLEAIRDVFKNILEYAKRFNETVGIPYKYGCGIAKGNWQEVEKLFEELSNESGVDISVYKLNND